jgi:hypothetical protein
MCLGDDVSFLAERRRGFDVTAWPHPDAAQCLLAVLDVLDGRHIPLTAGASKVLFFMLEKPSS